jgi:hypothetical protein
VAELYAKPEGFEGRFFEKTVAPRLQDKNFVSIIRDISMITHLNVMKGHSCVYRDDTFRAVQARVQAVSAPIPDIRRMASIPCTFVLVDIFAATIEADDLIQKVLAIEAHPLFVRVVLQYMGDFILMDEKQ